MFLSAKDAENCKGIMDVVEYVQLLTDRIEGTPWECCWMGEHSPYLHLPSSEGAPRLYISAGIHGDEPAGPMAVLSMLGDVGFFDGVEVFAFPLLNPGGITAGTRENVHGIDLNRNFGPAAVSTPESDWHLEMLKSLPKMDIALCLHEDWEASGVYLYHVEPKRPQFQAPAVLDAMARHLPKETSCVIDGSQACGGIISRQESDYLFDEWPESIYLTRTMTRASFTLETPSSAPLDKRVAALCAAVAQIVDQVRR